MICLEGLHVAVNASKSVKSTFIISFQSIRDVFFYLIFIYFNCNKRYRLVVDHWIRKKVKISFMPSSQTISQKHSKFSNISKCGFKSWKSISLSWKNVLSFFSSEFYAFDWNLNWWFFILFGLWLFGLLWNIYDERSSGEIPAGYQNLYLKMLRNFWFSDPIFSEFRKKNDKKINI